MPADLPRVVITEEALREGMQIESTRVTVDQKLRLLDAIADAGVSRIVVGSFVSPKWTPQMARIDELVARMEPRPGVEYLALALNDVGRERMRRWSPPLTLSRGLPETHGHLCDIFVKRNTNRTIEQHERDWPAIVERAASEGVPAAGIGLSAAWGSNWRGRFSYEQRLAALERQAALWEARGIRIAQLTLADPMGWNMPHVVAEDLRRLAARWPSIERVRLHLHDQRGMALTSIYAAVTALSSRHTLDIDSSVGGIGGCPYCGNGRAAGMAPTEDLAQLLEAMGVDTGIDLARLVEAAHVAAEILGRPLHGRVAYAGPLPGPDELYSPSLPLIETFEQAQHFRLGPGVAAGQRRPWEES